MVFPRYNLAVFVDGDFRHGRDFCEWGRKLSPTRNDKIGRNMERDRETDAALNRRGWRVLRFWGSDVKSQGTRCIDRIISARERLYRSLRSA